jgi:Tfp pilus assembly ATPase PilU
MQTFDQHLADLVTEGMVEYEVALAASTRPSDFELTMRTFRRASKSVSAKDVNAAAGNADTPAMDGIVPGGGMDFLGPR